MQLEPADGADLVAADLARRARARTSAMRGGDVARRRGACAIGVVPAWFDWPVMVSSCQEMPCTPVDGADGDALGLEHRALLDVQLDEGVRRRARARQRAGVADAGQLVAEAGAVDRRTMSSASSSASPPDVRRGCPSMSGAKRAPSSSVKNATASGSARGEPGASASVSITSSPASTPRLPS